MNWGKGIIAGMIIFMLFILSMCIYMFRMPKDEYDHQYYEKGLSFNQDYAKERQVLADQAQPQIRVTGAEVTIAFTGPAKGTAKFIRPSSAAMDKTFNIQTGAEKTALLPVGSLARGRWRILLEWESGSKNYLYEKEVAL
ncbi:FixH family protein [Mucilaginibacter sp.]|jgi:hypothetical protein|uniref:FixH family protein n=1 Tax=Mucilaginibacter sp. TaxID=1882438 RepID=UPI00356A9E8D